MHDTFSCLVSTCLVSCLSSGSGAGLTEGCISCSKSSLGHFLLCCWFLIPWDLGGCLSPIEVEHANKTLKELVIFCLCIERRDSSLVCSESKQSYELILLSAWNVFITAWHNSCSEIAASPWVHYDKGLMGNVCLKKRKKRKTLDKMLDLVVG